MVLLVRTLNNRIHVILLIHVRGSKCRSMCRSTVVRSTSLDMHGRAHHGIFDGTENRGAHIYSCASFMYRSRSTAIGAVSLVPDTDVSVSHVPRGLEY